MTTHVIIPGTVHLVDLPNTFAAKHAGGALKDVVLVPAPSSDPDDPLNWTKSRKTLSTVSMCVFVMATGLAASCVYSIIVPISADTGLSINGQRVGAALQVPQY